jgi:hypothetical protein
MGELISLVILKILPFIIIKLLFIINKVVHSKYCI